MVVVGGGRFLMSAVPLYRPPSQHRRFNWSYLAHLEGVDFRRARVPNQGETKIQGGTRISLKKKEMAELVAAPVPEMNFSSSSSLLSSLESSDTTIYEP